MCKFSYTHSGEQREGEKEGETLKSVWGIPPISQESALWVSVQWGDMTPGPLCTLRPHKLSWYEQIAVYEGRVF